MPIYLYDLQTAIHALCSILASPFRNNRLNANQSDMPEERQINEYADSLSAYATAEHLRDAE